MTNFFKEFREFALRSRFVEISIGIFIGAGLTPVAISLINDLVMPFVAYIIGRADFTDLFFVLKPGQTPGPYITVAAAKKAGAITVNYGTFINTALSFLTISWVAFLVVKGINKIKRQSEKDAKTEEDSTKMCPFCLSVIPVRAKKCSQCTSSLEEHSSENTKES